MRICNTETFEKLKIRPVNSKTFFGPCPENKAELKELIDERVLKYGINCNLNDIDVSKVEDMSSLFSGLSEFNGDISR